MNTHRNSSRAIQIAQMALWGMVLLSPVIFNILSGNNKEDILTALKISMYDKLPVVLLYFLNFYWFVPYFLFRRNSFKWFVVVNVAFITAVNVWLYTPISKFDENMRSVLGGIIIFSVIFMIAIVAGATGMRYVVRWNEMELKRQEESQKNTEAELVWLRNQLNPHFLFNTLNNISSLVCLDTDRAQDSLSQLSDLLRYALYDSRQKEVPLTDEIEFMRNYITLMRLRYDETVDIRTDFPDPAPPVRCIPLLFISLIENAFKHGINNRRPSFVHLRLAWEADRLRFDISNSLHPKSATDRVGSGIGIENLRRRLELAYPGRYSYQQQQTETQYQTTITIKP